MPEVHLSVGERRWAVEQRARWPGDRPVCILSTRCVTEGARYQEVDWQMVAQAWQQSCLVVQPILTRPPALQDGPTCDLGPSPSSWGPESVSPGVVIFRDLSCRQYLALLSVADFFCGGLSGGAHGAAAFGVPSLILVWRHLLEGLRFPVSTRASPTKAFLYPQHDYLATEDVPLGRANASLLQMAVASTMVRTRRCCDQPGYGAELAGRPPGIRELSVPSGGRLARTTRGRLLRLPRAPAP
jgi:hypothetical protein